MLTPELSRLKGAPSTGVCSVEPLNEKANIFYRLNDEGKAVQYGYSKMNG